MKSMQPIAQSDSRSEEQLTWSATTERQIEIQLIRAKAYVDEHCSHPRALYPHCSSLLTLIDQARNFAPLRDSLISLIVSLGDWPTRWGFWQAWEQGLHFGLQAAQDLGDIRRWSPLLNELSQLYMLSGRMDQALELQQQTFVAAIAAEDLDLAVSVTELLVHMLVRKGRMGAVDECLSTIEKHLLIGNASDKAKARWLAIQAKIYRRRGELSRALVLVDEAIMQLEKVVLTDPQILADVYDQRGIIYWALGDYLAAENDLNHTAEMYVSLCNPYAHSRVLGSLGIVYWSQGKLDDAESSISRAMRIKEEHDDYQTMSQEVGNLGLVYLSRGRLDRAALYIQRHRDLAQKARDTFEEMRAVSNMSAVLLHRGKYREALPGLQADEAFQEGNDNSEGLVCDFIWHAGCFAGMGQPDDALELAQRAHKMAKVNGSTALRVVALRCLAKHSPRSEQDTILREALELAKQSHRQLDEAACLLSLATLQDGLEQKELWDQGRRLLRKIGATSWLKGRSAANPPDIIMIA